MLLRMGLFLVCACVLYPLVRQYAPSYGMVFLVAAAAGLLGLFLHQMPEIQQLLGELSGLLPLGERFALLVRLVLIGVVGQYTESLCRDSGQASLAVTAGFCCRVMMLLAAFPLLQEAIREIWNLLG